MNTHFGVDYYPEHWDKERMETDIALMKEMGISIARLAEFSWSAMEPEEGHYTFDWLVDAVNKLGEAGIVSILGTPSAAPPAWMMNKHPEIFPVNENGIRITFNGRHHDCQSNETYRDYIRKFVTKMAETFKDNPYVVGWQIDNEFGNGHGDLCFCDSCRTHFNAWLKNKYKNVEALNKAWGTHFWSQHYNDFSEVFTPSHTAAGRNPSTFLDWMRFCSDLIVDFQNVQVEIIRKICPNHFITHNCMGFSGKVDYYDLGKDLDFVTHDQYPGGFYLPMPSEDEAYLAQTLDVMRAYKNKNFWIMEQQSGPTGWEILGRTPKPGQLTLWAAKSIAHGADNIIFFRWRTCTVGTEQYWHGILPHNGVPNRRYYELKDMVSNWANLMEKIQGLPSNAKVAMVYSYDQYHAIEIQPHHPDLEYVKELLKYYRPFYDNNIAVDMVADMADFSKYDLVIAPLQYIMTPELEKHYEDYVSNGGTLVLTMRTGVKDINNICMTDYPLPGKLGDMLGIEILDYDCLRDTSVKVEFEGREYDANIWSDIITLKGAEKIGTYKSEFYKGEAAVTVNKFGKGYAVYVGTEPDEAFMSKLADYLCNLTGISKEFSVPAGVEVVTRKSEDTEYVFFLNHNEEEQSINIPSNWKAEIAKEFGKLKPFEAAVYSRVN